MMAIADQAMRRRDLLALIALAAACFLRSPWPLTDEKKKLRPARATSIQITTAHRRDQQAGYSRASSTSTAAWISRTRSCAPCAKLSLPRLRAAYVQTDSGLRGRPARQAQPPNTDFIGMALQRQTDTLLGRKGARLLLGAIMAN